MFRSWYFLVILMLLVTAVASAQSVWTRMSPVNSKIWTIETIDDSIVLIGADNGKLYRSTNAGSTWIRVDSLGYAFTRITRLPDGNLYSGSSVLKRSSDNGTTWTSVSSFTNTGYLIRAIHTDESYRSFTGTQGNWSYRSTDTMRTWSQISSSNGLTRDYVFSYLSVGNNCIAGTYCGAVFLSTNGGTNWVQRANGLMTGGDVLVSEVNSLLFLPPNTVIAAGGYSIMGGGSENGGLYFSDTTCMQWTKNIFNYPLPTGFNAAMNSLLQIGNEIYLGTSSFGIGKSTNGGVNWEWMNDGLPQTGTSSIRPYVCVRDVKANSGGFLFAATDSGLFRRSIMITGVTQPPRYSLPVSFTTLNFPNPFNNATSIEFTLPTSGLTVIRIFDATGRLVAEPLSGHRPAGQQIVRVTMPPSAPSGNYFYEVIANGVKQSRKMTYSK